MSSKRRFEFQDGGSNKFWEISKDDSDVTTVWGRIGTDGQSKTKSFGSLALAEKEYEKLVKEKTGKGYLEVTGNGNAKKSSLANAAVKGAASVVNGGKTTKAATKATKAETAKSVAKKVPAKKTPASKTLSKKAINTKATIQKGTTPKEAVGKVTTKDRAAKKAAAAVVDYAPDHFDDILMKHAREKNGNSSIPPKKFKHGKWLLEQTPDASLVILRAAFRLGAKAKKEFKSDTLWDLRDCLLKRSLPYTLKDIEFLCKKVSTALTHWGIDPMLIRPIEVWVSSDPSHVLSDKAKENLSLIRNNKKKLANIWMDQSKQLARIDKLLGQAAQQPLLEPDCPWSIQATKEVADMKPAQKVNWHMLLQHSVLVGSSPKEKWAAKARELVQNIGGASFQTVFQRWAESVSQKEVDGKLNFIEDSNEHILCGLVWCTTYQPTDRAPAILGSLATAMYRSLPGIGVRSARVGNACIAALGRINSLDSISQLAIVKSKIKKGNLQRMVAKQLEACVKSRNTSLADLEELTIPTYGLTEVGARVEACEKLRVKVIASGPKSVDIHWYDEQNKPLGKLPSKLSDTCSAWIAEIKQDADDLKKMLIVQRDRIEAMFCLEKTWEFRQWRERYLDGLLVGVIARSLIWRFKENKSTRTGIWHGGAIVDANGKKLTIGDQATVALWHPLDGSPEEIKAWRKWIVDNQIQQSLKQAFREVYLLTDAEKKTKNYSNRFAAHILKQSQFRALAQQRNWKAAFLGGFDGGDGGDTIREIPHLNLSAAFTVNAVLGSRTEGYAYQYMTSDRVRFTSPIGWKGKPQPLAEIPPVVFSEMMRDVDLFVGVCSVGNDPNWQDRGRNPDYQRYWENYSTADLAESGKSRHAALAALLPRMKQLSANCQLRDKYLRVQGKKDSYLIHLGSSNIRMESNNQYLCIVPKGKQDSFNVVLPFEGDFTLSLILSKAFMLIEDDKIKDPQILTQLSS